MMPLATLFEDDMEIKIFSWNAFTKKLFTECTDRKFGVKREATVQVPVETSEEIPKKILLETKKQPSDGSAEKKLQEAAIQHLLSDGPGRGRPKNDHTEISEKYCPDCKTKKQVGEFCKNNNSKDGLQTYCKICSAKRVKISHDKKKKKISEKTGDAPVDNHLSEKLLKVSDGGDWDTTEVDILQENFFLLGGAEGGALKIYERKLLPGRSLEEITNMVKHMGMVI
jgi:hypothetical protein